MADDDDDGGDIPDWVLTFGDMMSLLLCFFVLLFSMSQQRQESMEAVIRSIVKQFGDPDRIAAMKQTVNLDAADAEGRTTSPTLTPEVERRHANDAPDGTPGRSISVRQLDDGNRVMIGKPILFHPGRTGLVAESRAAIADMARVIRGKVHLIEVRGFEPPELPPTERDTDSPSRLAYLRTRAVAERLAAEGIRPETIRLAIAAPVESRALERLETGRRMVDRVVVSTLESDGQPRPGNPAP